MLVLGTLQNSLPVLKCRRQFGEPCPLLLTPGSSVLQFAYIALDLDRHPLGQRPAFLEALLQGLDLAAERVLIEGSVGGRNQVFDRLSLFQVFLEITGVPVALRPCRGQPLLDDVESFRAGARPLPLRVPTRRPGT